jgi:uncharacterized protein (TIGR03435 family)
VKPPRPFDPKPYNWTGEPGTNDPGRFTAVHTTLSYLIMRAWGNDLDQWKGPLWLNDTMSGGYDISATMPASTAADEFCGMLRNLLTERLHLTFHYEKQLRPGYELTVLRGGPKFREFVPRCAWRWTRPTRVGRRRVPWPLPEPADSEDDDHEPHGGEERKPAK